MSTPSKNLVKYAEQMPVMRNLIKSAQESLISTTQDFEDVIRFKNDPDTVKKQLKHLLEILNQLLEYERRLEELILNECATVKQAFLFGEEEMLGKHRPENLNINTGLAHKAPRLTPRVGYDEAMKRLNQLRPKKGDSHKISIRQIAGCLGQVGSESHIVEFWTMAEPEDKTRGPIKTNGILNFLTPDGTVFFFQAKEFVKQLYENYYLGLIKGEIVAISTHDKGKIVRFHE